MSHIPSQPEQSDLTEIELLRALDDLAVSPSGQYIRKTGTGSFENSTPAGDGGLSAPINATDIANGSVTNTEFQYLDGATSNIQTQLNNAQTQINTKATKLDAIAYAIALG